MPDILPIDQALRDEFAHNIDENFVVKCPAGSGKTRAIIDRIAWIATRPNAVQLLPQLVVVTFTQKAAQEMQERARAEILRHKPSPAVLSAFNRAFFGTIHSFAKALLRRYGHHIGVPSMFEVIETDDSLWREFLQQHNGRPSRMDPEVFAALTRIYPFANLLDLVRGYTFTRPAPVKAGAMPLPNLCDVLTHALPKRADQAANIKAHQQALSDWRTTVRSPGDFLPLPCPTTGGKDFLEKVTAALKPIRIWMGLAVAEAVHDLALDYRDFRITNGQLTFNDLVALAAGLFKNGRAAREMRSKDHRVILDEAQDTDPHQFTLLIEITRPVAAGKQSFMETLSDGPRPGRYCQVGDDQQAIYGDRADLGYYLAVQQALTASGCAKEIGFSVTFRCDQSIVDLVNNTCPSILHGATGQVNYVNLVSRPAVEAGQVLRLQTESRKAEGKTDYELALEEARHLGRWLRDTGLEKLRARCWSEVALLCPRKDWFTAIRQGLADAGLPCQFQSTREIYGDSPAYAWMTALVVIWSEPRNALEIFGVLREVFALSDHEIAVYVDHQTDLLSITERHQGQSDVAGALSLLSQAREYFSRLPLREALGAACDLINLRGRLASLPAGVYPDLIAEYETILLCASEAEAAGQTLEEFAGTMREQFKGQIATPEASADTLPIITNLKAKGLQWDCVVIPFFGREISSRALPYPRFLPAGCPVPIAFSAGEVPDEWNTRIQNAKNHELERVLYVTLTRPKHTLVIVDDISLWTAGEDGSVARNSFAKALRVDAENRGHWDLLNSDCNANSEIVKQHSAVERQLAPSFLKMPEQLPSSAAKFPRRILPHTLAHNHRRGRKIEDPEQAATVNPDQLVASLDESAALKYGAWWHALMQALPWNGSRAALDGTFHQMLAYCPAPTRGEREWLLLLDSEIGQRLMSGKLQIRVEMPFMAPLRGGDSVDGIIDLAARDTETGQWIVVDWKTNLCDDLDALVDQYGGQVRAYAESLAALTGSTVNGYVYSTATGLAKAA